MCVFLGAAAAALVLVPPVRAWEEPTRLNDVARFYSRGVGEVRCPGAAEWAADPNAAALWGYTNVHEDYSVLAPAMCEGALNVGNPSVPAWQRAVATLVLVHEAFHLRHWRFRRDEGKVECQAMVYFTDAAQKLGASEPEANNLYPYALAWHLRQTRLLPWYRDPKCVIPPWIPPVP